MVFLTPLFLIGLLAALIPIAIHLIRREKPPQNHVQYYQVPEENLEEIGTLSAPATNITFAASVSGYCTPGHGLCTTVNKPVSCPIAGRRSSIRRDPIGSLYEHAV
ncbi:MAG: hypothetical protein CM1200mP40_11790 [Gammaproteobacteria bacterium]|nr:MAG: hypothetical protein CM1200mP40_11790 [Gammaproteobacteria bacterium]